MSSPFDLGDLSKLTGMLQSTLGEMNENASSLEVEGKAGGGMVSVRINGKNEVLQVRIAPEAAEDLELLEDLVAAAFNEALRRVQEQSASKMSDLLSGLPLPPGLF